MSDTNPTDPAPLPPGDAVLAIQLAPFLEQLSTGLADAFGDRLDSEGVLVSGVAAVIQQALIDHQLPPDTVSNTTFE